MVGTPRSEVHRSCSTADSVATGLYDSGEKGDGWGWIYKG